MQDVDAQTIGVSVENLASTFRDRLTSFMGNLGNITFQEILHYNNAGESGVALDLLCSQIYEYDIPLLEDELKALVNASKYFNNEWMFRVDRLKEQVKPAF